MTLTITRLDRTDRDIWDAALARAPDATLFHQFDALQVVAEHSGTTPHLLVGVDDGAVVGLLPVFEERRGRRTNVLSPPWLLANSPVGPVVVDADLSATARETLRASFVAEATDWIHRELAPDFTRVRVDGRFGDVRPFLWHGFEATPQYTYVVDLSGGPDAVFANFSKDARTNIRKADPERYEITERGVDAIDYVLRRQHRRLAEQDKEYRLTSAFVTDLYETLPDGQIRPFVCAIDGEDVSGQVVLEYGRRVYAWEGGARHGTELPVTDLLDWHAMCKAMDRGLTEYDLVGANTPRLCEYKAKFGPRLETYYNVSRRDGVAAVRHEVASAATHLPSLSGISGRVPALGSLGRLFGLDR